MRLPNHSSHLWKACFGCPLPPEAKGMVIRERALPVMAPERLVFFSEHSQRIVPAIIFHQCYLLLDIVPNHGCQHVFIVLLNIYIYVND